MDRKTLDSTFGGGGENHKTTNLTQGRGESQNYKLNSVTNLVLKLAHTQRAPHANPKMSIDENITRQNFVGHKP